MAKEYRDHLMRDYAQVYPHYGFDKNVDMVQKHI